jgi:NSS family neurotransmitter:Na+ symporter
MVLMPLPMFLLFVLFVQAMTLPGSGTGLSFYLTPDFSRLGDPRLWVTATGQIFFSLSLAVGAMVRFGLG